jgi:lysophospholipase L1-like esterase
LRSSLRSSAGRDDQPQKRFGSQFEPEEPQERELRRRIVEESHLAYVYVLLDPDDRVENDGHPDADGARDIAKSIADALKQALGSVD